MTMTVRARPPSRKIILIERRIAGKVAECIGTYNRFVSHIEELGLVNVGDAKTLLTVSTPFIALARDTQN